MRKQSGVTFIELVCLLSVIVFIESIFWAGVCTVRGGCGHNYSNGYRVGTVMKFYNKGLIKKSWIGDLDLGRMTSDSDGRLVRDIWAFAVDVEGSNGENVDEVVAEVNRCVDSGKKCKLYYNQTLVPAYWVGSQYAVYKAEVLEEK